MGYKNHLIFFLLFFFISKNQVFSQIKIIDTIYQTFDSRIINVYLIEGRYTVANIDKNQITKEQLNDTATIQKIVYRIDTLYGFYKSSLGYEPPGGNLNYSNKCNVFFGAPSCGSGCGLIGLKGIECSGFNNIYFNLKYNTNVNRDVILGHEFGRNFFTFGNKIWFPVAPNTNQKNGGFAEAFSSIMYVNAFNKILVNPLQRIFNETLYNIQMGNSQYLGYINDTLSTPYNNLANWDVTGFQDANRPPVYGVPMPSWNANSILYGLAYTFGYDNLYPAFFYQLRNLPDAITIKDALSNIAIATCKSLNKNLKYYFLNVLKFDLNASAIQILDNLPLPVDSLIKYENRLWFISPFNTIRLNLRNINYLGNNYKFRIKNGDSTISESVSGNNELKYSILGGKDSVSITSFLINNNNIAIDSFKTVLRKQHNINLLDFKDKIIAYYLANIASISYTQNDNLVIENYQDTLLDQGLLYYTTIYPRNRLISLSADIKQISKIKYNRDSVTNFSNIYFGTGYRNGGNLSGKNLRVGYDVGQNDSSYFHQFASDSTQYYTDTASKLTSITLGLTNFGKGIKSYFKNLILRDETDTDHDGIVDFEDDCPLTPNPPKPSISWNGSQLSTVVSGSMNIQWLLNNNVVAGATNAIFKPSLIGNYKVQISNQDGCINQSDSISIVVTAINGPNSTSNSNLAKLIPNPASNEFKVEFQHALIESVTIQLINSKGQVIKQVNSVNQNTSIFLNGISTGNYFVQIIGKKYNQVQELIVTK